jgi:hypothetical protein
MSYRLKVRILVRQSVVSASGSIKDAIDSGQSGATHCLRRETACREGAWPVKKVADGPRKDADETPNNHIFFVVALSKGISLATKQSENRPT